MGNNVISAPFKKHLKVLLYTKHDLCGRIVQTQTRICYFKTTLFFSFVMDLKQKNIMLSIHAYGYCLTGIIVCMFMGMNFT